MKTKLQFLSLLFLIGLTIHAKSGLGIKADPNATATISGSTTICPGNVATLTINGTPNCIVRIDNPLVSPNAAFIPIGASGTALFTTPILNSTVTYTLIQISEFSTGIVTPLTGSATITVVPNGCTTVLTNSPAGPNSWWNCTPGECRTLIATPTEVPSTAEYDITSIPYCPQAAFTGPGHNNIDATNDDVWSQSITLPFNFSFFDQNYTSCQVGSNGIISFNPQVAPGFCNWGLFGLNIPNTDIRTPKNAILGAFQDIDFRTNGPSPSDASINWTLTGTYPCRKLIVNFYHIGQYQCNQTVGLQTTQIVLYEISNIIEVFVQNRTRCTSWENGDGVIGITNNAGTLGYVPSERNTNDDWTATNEAWRFTPSGPNVTTNVRWLQDGIEIASGLNATVCPTQTTSYTAEAVYIVSGVPFTVTGMSTINVAPGDETEAPVDIAVCYDASGIYTADLTTNNATLLGASNPNDYEIYYFTSLADAEILDNQITNPTVFSFTQDQTIYAGILNASYNCVYVKPFQLTILTAVGAPTGISPQTLNAGQTLSDLAVTGQNIQWYDAPQGGNLLPSSTIPQNNVTYYASQMVNNCESRTSLSARLAILVQVNLGNNEFDSNAFNFYPNPTSGILTLTSSIADVKLDVFNSLSQKIESRMLESGSNTISLNNLSSGVYLFQLSSEGKTKTYKIVKN